MLLEIAEKGAPLSKPEDPIWTTTIMTYELGNVIKALTKARNKNAYGDEAGERAYFGTARVELADLLTQGYLLAEQMGWKRIDLENDGLDRFRERMAEYARDLVG